MKSEISGVSVTKLMPCTNYIPMGKKIGFKKPCFLKLGGGGLLMVNLNFPLIEFILQIW